MIGLCDIRRVPPDDWPQIPIGDIAIRDVAVAYPHQNLSEVSATMYELDFDRLPVVNRSRPKEIIGIIASTDIVRFEELSEFIER